MLMNDVAMVDVGEDGVLVSPLDDDGVPMGALVRTCSILVPSLSTAIITHVPFGPRIMFATSSGKYSV